MSRDALHAMHMRELKRFAKALRLKVIHKDMEDEGVYSNKRRTIHINKDADSFMEMSILLHELGHAIDDLIINKYKNKENSAYINEYYNKSTANQKEIVMDCEKSAWHNGERIAKILGIDLGKWFHKYKRSCLRSYRG